MIIATLVYVYGAVLCLAAIFAGLLWYTNRAPLYRSHFFLWASAIVSFVLQGAFQNLEISGFLAYTSNIASVLCVLAIYRDAFELRLDLRQVWIPMLAGIFVSTALFAERLPFVVASMPFSVMCSLVIARTAITGLRHKTDSLLKGFSTLLLLSSIHFLDYPFLRPHPEFAVLGFSLALLFYFTYAVFIPLVLTKIIGDRHSDQLEHKVRERTKFLQAANTKLELLQEDLQIQYSNLQAVVEDNRILMSVLVHDIATPLSVMDGSLAMLQEQVEDTAGKKNLARLGRGLNNLKDMASRARNEHAQRLGKITLPGNIAITKPKADLSGPTLTSSEMAATRELPNAVIQFPLLPFNLAATIEETVDNYVESLKKKNLRIKVHNHSGADLIALGDAQHLKQQVLGNLITNAIKFSHPGGTIHIFIEGNRSDISIRVKDEGVGVPVSLADEIFSNNTPTSSIGTDGEVGTGLGLPIVRHFARKMGGDARLIVNAENESGACFEIKLKRSA